MKPLEQAAATWRDGAIVAIQQGEYLSFRVAAFVFEASSGALVWVEPGYRNPGGTPSPAMHATTGAVRTITAPDGEVDVFEADAGNWNAQVFALNEDTASLTEQSLVQFLSDLAADGTTWEAERERVRELIQQELAR